MPAVDLTTTDAPGLQLCTPLVAGQEASATGIAGARCGSKNLVPVMRRAAGTVCH